MKKNHAQSINATMFHAKFELPVCACQTYLATAKVFACKTTVAKSIIHRLLSAALHKTCLAAMLIVAKY